MRYLAILIITLSMSPATVLAHTTISLKYTCPVDGMEFSATTTGSDTTRGMMLDLQPIGMGSYPWPVASCPNDGMVMYKNDFTPEEIVVLKDYIPSPEYQKMVREDSSYWRIAQIKEKLGGPLKERWFTMLQATWQARSAQYEPYARETIKAIETLLATPDGQNEKDRETWSLLSGELYRRVGDFDKARAIFDNLRTQPAFAEHHFYPLIIDYELELIAAGDKSSHRIPDSKNDKSGRN